ncbi:hypothetical protein GPJ56_001143 [Histomonas meleagridis]|uniref:uncharacterized protein n=1 Tax=Histomonas meleagridis TaxID=135588 RepID=UPI00355AAF2E|nr:hypothetical protein GPJ56_001143 [Histomonas meleagridis]KAH0806470.1 hypothetical protein GO595_000632 [Histomonas meleagridis]
MSKELSPKYPIEIIVKSGEQKKIDFGDQTNFICSLYSIQRIETPESSGKIAVKVSYKNCESNTSANESTDVPVTTYTLVEIDEKDFKEKSIEFHCVNESEVMFSTEGKGSVKLVGSLVPDIEFTEEEEEISE